MPTYEYECLACKQRFERFQKFTDPAVSECPECGGQVRKVLFPAGVVFKGSGWYITDSRKTGSESTPEPIKSGTSTDTSKGEAAASGATRHETKSETKTESKSESGGSSAKSETSTPAKA